MEGTIGQDTTGGNKLPQSSVSELPRSSGNELPGASGKQRWSVLTASLTGWLVPATAARRTVHVKLRWAYVSHLIAAVLVVIVIFILASWAESDRPGGFWAGLDRVIGETIEEIGRHRDEFTAVLAGTVVTIEVGYVASAFVLMSWGARDERARSSFANALRQMWLHTSHVVVAVFLVGVLVVALERTQANWRRSHQPVNIAYNPPQPPANLTPGTQAWQDYQAAAMAYQRQYQQASRARWRSRPWYVRYNEELLAYACFAGATWILWALLRAVGADRRTPPVARAPTCERCGYNLTATPMESRCPECGERVVLSLGPDVRPGALWERRREVGRWRAWWRCSVDPMVRPRWFGGQLRAGSRETGHRGFLAMHLVPIFFIAAVGIIMCYVVDTGQNPLEHDAEVLWIVGTLVGYFTSACLFFTALLAAGLIGVGYAVSQKRNLMGAAAQAASYLGGYLMLWALLSATMAVGAFALEDWFDELEDVFFIDDEILAFFFWLLPNLACLLLYVLLVWRATTAARYANR